MPYVLSNYPLKYLFKDLGVQFKDKIKPPLILSTHM